ncbi:hypothetical protein E1265_26905 [Streptomyces sp. 8K308]|uniref:hypothetical protein n=1 Tax=Streptomyces sp. 8K308 TaxID=2530388 RepID=UPI001051C35D|nr:hypothetical protein [Streptomyces sp. 8K308]TDC15320.1 hypothetical protein E1265_26905 [Streptomyces sp. 8K308]
MEAVAGAIRPGDGIRIGGRACVVATAERVHNGSRLRAAHRRRHPLAQVVAGCVLVVALAVAVVAR